MNRSLSELIFADSIFLLFLSFSSLCEGALGSLFYAAAFILPVVMMTYLWRAKEEKYEIRIFAAGRESLSLSAFVFPIIFGVFLISFLVSMLLSLIGVQSEPRSLDGNLLYVIITSAIAPAIFEEMLFRYLPIKALGAHSPKLTVVYSTVLFALAHCSIAQIPYALFAGAAFMLLDIAAGSILPSMIIHFLNNLLSVVWQRNSENSRFVLFFLILISALTVISVFCIFLKRKKIKELFSAVLLDKSKVIFTNTFIFYVIAMLIAVFANALI